MVRQLVIVVVECKHSVVNRCFTWIGNLIVKSNPIGSTRSNPNQIFIGVFEIIEIDVDHVMAIDFF
ncbi:4734_t:CDS:1, partial [Funneliformis geosporum]